MLDDDETAELRELRARVFGAGADADAAALARWEELEARRVGSGPAGSGSGTGRAQGAGDVGDSARTEVDDARTSSLASTRPPVPETPAEVAAAALGSPDGPPSDPPRSSRRRRTLLLSGAVAGLVLALMGAYFAGASGAVNTPQAAASASPSSPTSEVRVGTGSVTVVDPLTGRVSRPRVAQVPVDEVSVRASLQDNVDPADLRLVARLDGMNLWWATSTDGKTDCAVFDGVDGMSTSCMDAAAAADGIGLGFGDGSADGAVSYWVTPDKAPYVEVGPDLQTLMDEHPPAATPFPLRSAKP